MQDKPQTTALPWRQRRILTPLLFELFMQKRLPALIALCGPTWPVEFCGDTCSQILHDLQAYFRGNFYIRRGYFDDTMPFRPTPHTWIEEVRTHTIVDPTVGQFRNCDQLKKPVRYDDGEPYRIFAPSDFGYDWYIIKHKTV